MSKNSAGDRTGLAQEASGPEAQLGKHEAYVGNQTSWGLALAPVGAAGEWPGEVRTVRCSERAGVGWGERVRCGVWKPRGQVGAMEMGG